MNVKQMLNKRERKDNESKINMKEKSKEHEKNVKKQLYKTNVKQM
jgi:hypothetical protein